MNNTPNEAYSITLRMHLKKQPGMLGRVSAAIGAVGGIIGAVDIVESTPSHTVRDITVSASSVEHAEQISAAVRAVPDLTLINVSDRTFLLHLGGKIEIKSKHPIATRADLSMAYTPGVARVCMAIHDDPEKFYNLTIKRNCIAVVTDGTAVLGLGDIGPSAAMPVMEGKAVLFKEFAGVDAFPICLDTKDPSEIVAVVKAIAPGFGGINLEDISAPRCFEIEDRLKAQLDIPVFHDDQHGTAIVVLAALLNALTLTGQRIEEIGIVICGMGAAGIAITRILLESGARRIIGCDSRGSLHTGRADYLDGSMHPIKRWFAESTNADRRDGGPADVIEGADLFIGVRGARVVPAEAIKR